MASDYSSKQCSKQNPHAPWKVSVFSLCFCTHGFSLPEMPHLTKSFLKASLSNDFIHLSPLDLPNKSTSSFAYPSLITSVFRNSYAILHSSSPPFASSLLLNYMFPGVVGWILSTFQNSCPSETSECEPICQEGLCRYNLIRILRWN